MIRVLAPLFLTVIAFVFFAISIDAIEAGAFADRDGAAYLAQSAEPRSFWWLVFACGLLAFVLVGWALKLVLHVAPDEPDDTSS